MRKQLVLCLTLALAVSFGAPMAAQAKSNAPAQTAQSAASDFTQALRLGQQNQPKPALMLVDRLLKAKDTGIDQDRLLMTKARLHFQAGDMKKALEVYQQIPSGSDYWLESLEEKAWAQLRMGNHGQALASLKTLKAPLFQPLVGPEPYFQAGLIHLRICDYPAIFEATKEFKEKFRPRLVAIQELAKNGTSAAAQAAVAKLASAPLEFKTIAAEANLLPRLFHRDVQLAAHVAGMKKGAGTSAVMGRMRQLAERDMKEISDILQKFQLLEAEVIQRIHMAERPNPKNKKTDIKKSSDVLVFKDTGEFWMDELDRFHVNVSGCPSDLTSGSQTVTGGKKL